MRRLVETFCLPSLVFLISATVLTALASAKTITVPAQQPTIQDAIAAAANGDIVLVSPGTYYENINFLGKAITVKSASGPAVTMIDGSTNGSPVVTFSANETKNAVFSGFTLQNGTSEEIYVQSASPTIRGNVINGGGAQFSEGAIFLQFGSGLIEGNIIINGNQANIFSYSDAGLQIVGNIIAASLGSGIYLAYSTGPDVVQQNTIITNRGGVSLYDSYAGNTTTLDQNLIAGNQSTGVLWQQLTGPITLVSNTIAANTPTCCGNSGSEIEAYPVDGATLQNNLIVATGEWSAVDCTYTSGATAFTNNDVFSAGGSSYNSECPDLTGTDGNLSADPLFADLISYNFHLQSSSPVIKAGTISAPSEPKKDFDGDLRTINGKIDIGADEYTATTTQTVSSYALHFAAQDVSTTSAPQSVTFTNNSKSSIIVNLIATGPSFSQTNNCGASVAAGASCQISVTFSPLIGGSIEGVLGIFTSATLNPEAVPLLGTGLAPQISFCCEFSFYGQIIGTTSSQPVMLSNTGQAPLLISSIVYSGPTDFVEANNCPIVPNSLAVGSSCTVTVTYTPTVVGSESGTVTITSNAGIPVIAYVNGSSISAGYPVLSPTSLTFPTTLIGLSSAPQMATLTNTGTGPLGITQIYSYGDFPETNNCPTILAVNASCTLTVTYTPSTQGSEQGSVTVYTDSIASGNLAVSGTGSAPMPTVSSLSLTSVPAGSPDTGVTIIGTGFVYSTQVFWNGAPVTNCCAEIYGSTQIVVPIPAADLATAGTNQISVFTPGPGGGTSNSLPFTVFTPINYASKATAYNYRNFTGTNLNLYYYTGTQITSPFPIQFGGGSYTNLTVSAGGTIAFNGFNSPYNDVIPTTQVPLLIAPFWDQLYPFGTGTDNNVFWQVQGTAPDRQFIIEWRDVGYCCETTNTVKFQVVFFEGNSNILFNYADTVFGGSYSSSDNGATASVGVQVAPNLGTQYSYYQPALASKSSILWYPNNPTATLSTSSVAFGYHQIGTSTLPQALTLTNGSLVPLTISSIATNNPDFTQTNTCGTSVAPHQSCSIHVVFKPTQPSTETATLTIVDNASNSPQTVALTGTGAITSIIVYPVLVNFGSVIVGQAGTAPVTLANASNEPLTIQQITAAPAVYTQTNNCGASLSPGQSCTIAVTFKPMQKGSIQGTLSMGLNGKAMAVKSNLTGSGS